MSVCRWSIIAKGKHWLPDLVNNPKYGIDKKVFNQFIYRKIIVET